LKQRFKKRAKKYKERDKIIFELRSKGYTIQQIADELGISFDATARRIYLMRKDGYEI
jgi:biotin operon repressor